jgi:hypothetical protein
MELSTHIPLKMNSLDNQVGKKCHKRDWNWKKKEKKEKKEFSH